MRQYNKHENWLTIKKQKIFIKLNYNFVIIIVIRYYNFEVYMELNADKPAKKQHFVAFSSYIFER
jgi:hypothetical protein